jgi:hypothetical protein
MLAVTAPASTSTSAGLDLLLAPSPAASLAAARSHRAHLTERSLATRAALGLPMQGPLVMTGHQAGPWHAGILAKYLYASSLAAKLDAGAWAHVVVDQDVNDAGAVSVPAADVSRMTIRLAPASDSIVTGRRPAVRVSVAATSESISPEVRAPLRTLMESLAAHAAAPSLAHQWNGAMHSLLAPWTKPTTAIFATRLATSPGFIDMVQAMEASSSECVAAYNAAAHAVPRARISPLRVRDGGVELPLWRIDAAKGTRHPVWSDELGQLDPRTLAPRALLLSAFMRLHACDLFIHGTGGGLYDQVTDAWLRVWRPEWSPAASAVATATLRLPFAGAGELPSPEAISRAWWLRHRAMHDPSLLGDATADARRRALVAAIAEARSQGRPARSLYLELHSLLEASRRSHGAELERLRAHAESLEASAARARVVHDRTWPWMLHSGESIARLRACIETSIDDSLRGSA